MTGEALVNFATQAQELAKKHNAEYNLEITEQVPLSVPSNPHNEKYLQTKKDRMGHTL